jgi:hypothetical protein
MIRRCGEEENLFLMPGIEAQFLCHNSRRLATVPTWRTGEPWSGTTSVVRDE